MNSYRATPKNRLILFGASNLTLSLRLVIHLMQQRLGGPSEIFTALGHGRGYGLFSQMLWRGLPGIADCGLWRELDVAEQHPAYALLTDIGNDILLGLPPEQILRALEWCVNQLHKHETQIVVTNLPIDSIESLSERRYIFFRNIFYPFCHLSRNETISRARIVHRGLVDMAAQQHFKLYEQKPYWFGLDGIHVKYWQRKAFYQDILRHFPDLDDKPKVMTDKREFLLTWQRRPEFAYKTVLGRTLSCQQPSGQLADGSSVCKC